MTPAKVPPPPTIYMTPEEFIAWRYAANLSKSEACKALGIARNTLRAYEAGKHIIPKYIWLACQTASAQRNIDRDAA